MSPGCSKLVRNFSLGLARSKLSAGWGCSPSCYCSVQVKGCFPSVCFSVVLMEGPAALGEVGLEGYLAEGVAGLEDAGGEG